MPQARLVSESYRPSSPLTGNESPAIYRGKNVLLFGQQGNTFYRAYAGSENIDEAIPATNLTGTITFSTSSPIVTGSGTSFQDELHLGQLLLASNGVSLVVRSLLSPTSFEAARLPSSAGTGVTATVPPRLSELDIYRCALVWGNAIFSDKGNIIAVGDEVLYKNGAPLAGESLTATRRAKIALFDSATVTYTVEELGFDDPPDATDIAVSVVTNGGTKAMSPGYYSFRVAYYSVNTSGYSNPSDAILDGMTGFHIVNADDQLEFDFSADTPPDKATGYIIYATAFNGASDISAVNAVQGAWFELVRVPFTSLTADSITLQYVDSDLAGTSVTFNNSTPPDADWVISLAGYVILVSTNGQGVNSTGREEATSPGPFVTPQKVFNIDGYPASTEVPTEKGETILGVVSTAGRAFLLTPNTLQALTPTQVPDFPFTLRPFWKVGFANPQNVLCIRDVIYGFSEQGPYRSIATGDDGAATNDFASSVKAQMSSWNAGYVYLAEDRQNQNVCFINTACRQNEQGYWESDIYLYNLNIYDWLPPVVLSDPDRDMIVSGAATVQNVLYFIAGGRRAGTTNQWDTWKFDSVASGQSVPWYLAYTYIDNGAEMTAKCVRKLRPKGKFTDASVQVYAVTPDSEINVADLEAGTNSAFSYDLQDSTLSTQYEVKKCRVRNALMYSLRIEGTSVADGTLEGLDSFEELAYEVDVFGQMR